MHTTDSSTFFRAESILQESVVLFLLLLFTILFPYLALLQPLGQTMLAVKWNLCAGNQEFAVAKLLGWETGRSCV